MTEGGSIPPGAVRTESPEPVKVLGMPLGALQRCSGCRADGLHVMHGRFAAPVDSDSAEPWGLTGAHSMASLSFHLLLLEGGG